MRLASAIALLTFAIVAPECLSARAQCGYPPDAWSTWNDYVRVCHRYGGHIENKRCVDWDTNWCHKGSKSEDTPRDVNGELERQRIEQERRRKEEEQKEAREKQEAEERFQREKAEALKNLKGVSDGSDSLKGIASENGELKGVSHEGSALKDAAPPLEPKRARQSCDVLARQVRLDRAQIERQMRTNELNQEELAEWKSLNDKAQKEAVLSGITFLLDSYTAGATPLRKSLTRLEHRANELAQQASSASKVAARTKYLAKLDSIMNKLAFKEVDLGLRSVVRTAHDTEEAWHLSRNTMLAEFRVAAKRNQDLREVLEDPYFKDAFIGDSSDSPGVDVIQTLTDHAVQELFTFSKTVDKSNLLVGRAVQAAVFVRDASYSALLSYFSKERVLQDSDLAGRTAIAAGALQKQYKKSFDDLRACQAQVNKQQAHR